MFAVKNTEENSGEAYKLSSDVGAYVFALLKSPKAGFLQLRRPAFCRVGKRSTNQSFVVSILLYDCFLVPKCRVVDVWSVKAMFSDEPPWCRVSVRGCTVIDRVHGYALCNY